MHLLERTNADEICLTRDYIGHNIPPYAILSHTWGAEEVTFKDLTDGTGKGKLGYDKIRFCRDRAWHDGLQYFWVDTCCINKPDNTELQEAINSMFSWYRNAAKCYVYLTDVSTSYSDAGNKSSWKAALEKSRWFTRGWTLQELIAPVSVEFFSKEGILLGDRTSLEMDIHHITRIPFRALQGCPLSDFSVAERLAWMAGRETTRKEDKAYALLGMFDIHMPLIYGEGEKNALRRLREEINKASKSVSFLIPVVKSAAFDSRAEEHRPRCHPDTRIELLRQILTWASDPQGECIFWLNGAAGTGKSTISRTVADRFKEQGVLGASFFFKRGEHDRGNAGLLFTTMAVQLASHESRMSQSLKEAIDSDPDLAMKSLKKQFESLILHPLGQIQSSPSNRTIIVVVDALDECDSDDDVRLIIHLFSQARVLNSVRLRVFVTSRPELPIRLGFKDIRGKYQDVTLHQIPEPVIEHDISAFLTYELAKIRDDYNSQAFDEQQLPPDWPGKQIIQALVRMAVPLFIFAATVCRFVADETWLDPAGQLGKVLDYGTGSDSELDKLESSYLPVLNQLLGTETSSSTRKRLLNEFRDIVGPIVLLAQPMSASSLSHLLCVSIPSIARTVNRLHAVLDVPATETSPIRPFHLSFRDFLVDTDKRDIHPFWIDEKVTHETIATRCIDLLSSGSHLKADICDLKTPGIPRADIEPAVVEWCLPAHVRYACLYWVYHLRKSEACISDSHRTYFFLEHHFLYWLEALSLLGKVSESMHMISSLQTLVKSDNSTGISALLQDSTRFLLNYRSIIDSHPLQIYSSAVVFAPKRSVIRTLFEGLIPEWISLKPEVDQDWNVCLQTLEGHSDSVNAVAFSPNGMTVASASHDRTVRLWDSITGEHKQTLDGHSDSVNSIAFSPDGKTIASASSDKTVRLWDTITGEQKRAFEGHNSWINAVAFSPDGKMVVYAPHDNTVRLLDVATGEQKHPLQGHSSWVNAVAFSPNGKMVVSASNDTTVQVWGLVIGVQSRTFKGHRYSVNAAAFLPDGDTVISASSDKTVRLWDITTGQQRLVLTGHTNWVNSVACSPDGKTVVSASSDTTARLWDAITGEEKLIFQGHRGWIGAVAFSPDGTTAVTASSDETIRLWDVTSGRTLDGGPNRGGTVKALAFSPDGKTVAESSQYQFTMGRWPPEIQLRDAITGKWKRTLQTRYHSHGDALAFSPDGQTMAWASSDRLVLWDMTKNVEINPECVNSSHVKPFHAIIAFSPNGKMVASISGGWVMLSDTTTGRGKWWFDLSDDSVTAIAFSPDNKAFAAASSGKAVRLWNVATLGGPTIRRRRSLEGHSGPVNAVTFSPDGKTVATASQDRTIRLWDTITAEQKQVFPMNQLIVRAAFSADGRYLRTDRGLLKVFPNPVETPLRDDCQIMQLFCRDDWVINDGKKVLWLPPDQRPTHMAHSGDTFVFGYISGRVSFIRFTFS